jgi:hypothetical protein
MLPFVPTLLMPMALLLTAPVLAANQAIYGCTDAKGRKISADRPIAECMDRQQQELTRFGTVKRTINPPLTAQEQAAHDEKERVAADLLARQQEEKRRDRALLLRYPNRMAHDKERGIALAQIDEVVKSASVPPTSEASAASDAANKRLLEAQEAGKKRVHARFDEELVKLTPLWGVPGTPSASKPFTPATPLRSMPPAN